MNRGNLIDFPIENFGLWPLWARAGLGLGLSVMVFLAGYKILIHKELICYRQLKIQEHSLKTDLKNRQRQNYNLAEYRKQIQQIKTNCSYLLSRMSPLNDVSKAMERISKAVAHSGLKMDFFAPQAELKQEDHVALPIKVLVRGDYFQIMSFIIQMVEIKQIVAFEELVIEQHTQGLIMRFIIKIFFSPNML